MHTEAITSPRKAHTKLICCYIIHSIKKFLVN